MHLLFDLDGTLTDSFPGISRSINHTLTALGRDPVPLERLRTLVGTRLVGIFTELLGQDDQALVDRAVEIYRRRFDESGILDSRAFPGIPEALGTFRDSGHSLRIVTVRSAGSARHVVRHLALERYFDAVHAPEPSERACDKADLVRDALGMAGADSEDAIMIGDRADDVRAARAHGVRTVAVAWGYGARTELMAARPDYLAVTIANLVAWVQSAG